ncbi:DNA polymerase [Neobacillus mesonae]|uniref:DNA polymerase I n=1 Tax=Neobacillus mesonae TaxID=1193713 RepID=A0A3T0HV59_9BACI|nr:DNA polymerase [Neobacillus mesonae]AZU61032.1 DNA polymerase I [Neobacillus mesonae]
MTPSKNVRLTLNLNDVSQRLATQERIRASAEKKKAATETLDEAWARILEMKNSDADQAKLFEVKNGMAAGLIGRDPASVSKKLSKAEALRMWRQLHAQQREETLRRMVEETPANYELITTERQFQSLLADLANEPIIAVDTETTGVDVYTDVIVGMSFTLPKADKHVYIPVAHDTPVQLSRDYVLDGLAQVLNDESIGKVLHNAIFDIAMFRRHGSDIKGVVWDTMIAMHLLNENEPSFKLKDLAPKYLGVESDTFDTLFGKDAQFKEVPLDIALVYAAKDTDLTWRLYEFQRRHMEKMPTILEYYQTVEVPLLYVIVDLEANGYILDLEFAKEYGEQLRKRAKELSAKLIAALTPFHTGDETLNLNSTQQMRPALSKAIGKELPNMDAKKTLKPLKGEFEIVADLLEYKNITKLSGTYIDALPLKQNPTTKRWHSRFNPMGTVTGRFSSGKDEEDTTGLGFNAQNQPQEARPMFVAPPGKVLVGADFKAQEIRCVAYLSEEPVLINAFLEERDPYAMMASNFYKRPYEEVYKNADGSDTKERKQMKVVWLATLYGMSKYSLAEMLGVDVKAAVQFQKELFESMPKLNAWIEGNKKFVEKYGFVWTDKEARKRRLPDGKLKLKGWSDPNFSKKNRALRQGTNARVQGSSSIQTKVTMLRAHEYCKNKQGWSLWATVHDELIFEVPDGFTPDEAQDIRNIMLNSYRWGDVVPNGTDIEVMRRWGEGVPVSEWFKTKGETK